MEQKIVQTNNTIYKLVGDGEHYETDNFTVYAHMQGGLTFNQVMCAIALETKIELESGDED